MIIVGVLICAPGVVPSAIGVTSVNSILIVVSTSIVATFETL